MHRVALLVAALSIGVAVAGQAQSSGASELRRQRVIVDSVGAFAKRAKARLVAFDDSVAKSRVSLDTIRAGSLQVLVTKSSRSRLEPMVGVAASRFDSIFGSAAKRLETHSLVIRQRWDSVADTVVISMVIKPGKAFPKGREFEVLWGPLTDTLVQRGLRQGAIRLLSDEVSWDLRGWLGSELTPDTVSAYAWTQVRLELVSSSATVARRCYDGDMHACQLTLLLTPVKDRATEWFDSTGRHRYVSARTFDVSPVELACQGGNDKACIAAIRNYDWNRTSFPATGVLITSVTQTAMRIGGHDALDRLLSSKGTPAVALEAAAGVPLDSVLRVWQRNARETRLPSQDVSLGIAGSSLLWILVCGALSLRSSKWR